MTADFSSETLEARMKCCNIFYLLKEKNWQPRILRPVKTSFRNGEINTLSDEGEEKFVTIRPTLKERLKGVF